MIEQAVILAGGRGERLRPLTDSLPKPLVPVAGKPFLDRLIAQLRGQGIKRILILTGYRGDQIAEHYAGRVGVECRRTPDEWGTGQRLSDAPLADRFLLCYGDVYAPVNLAELEKCHEQSPRAATISVTERPGTNAAVDGNGKVWRYSDDCEHVEIGYTLVNRQPLCLGEWSKELEFLAERGSLAAFDPGLFHYSLTDAKSLAAMESYFRPKRMVLLDRDGTLNQRAALGEYVTTPEQWQWKDSTVRELEKLVKEGFTFAVCTNQPGVARGMTTLAEVHELNRIMQGDAERRFGIRIHSVHVCPHDRGSTCQCRKPAPGLLYAACKEHQLFRTVYIGDDERDCEAATRACIPFVHVDGFRAADVLAKFREWEANP